MFQSSAIYVKCKAVFEDFLRTGLPDDHANIPEMKSVRTLNLCTFLVVFVGIPFIFKYKSMGLDLMSLAVLSAVSIGILNLIILRKTHKLVLCGNIAVLTLFSLLIISNSISGGFYDPNFSLLYTIPLAAGFVMGYKALLAYFILIVITTLIFFLMPHFGYAVPDLIPTQDHPLQSLANRLSAIGLVGALGFGFLYQRYSTQNALDEASRKVAWAALDKKALELSERSNRIKDEFLSSMSHELRTPLNGIVGALDLIRINSKNHEMDNLIDTANTSAGNMLGMIERILTLAELQAGTYKPRTTRFQFLNLLQQQSVKLEKLCATKNLFCNIQFDGNLKNQYLGDPKLLNQMLDELIDNAVKFTASGSIDFRASLINDGDDYTTIEISIRDTGCGITEDKQNTIFDNFQQADGTSTRAAGGVGIGLSIVKHMVQLLNGSVSVQSQPDLGSLFVLKLDLRDNET